MKIDKHLEFLKAPRGRRTTASRGERVIASLFPNRGYGGFGAWTGNRMEQVQHLKNWTGVAIDAIGCQIGQIMPNMAYVYDEAIPGKTEKYWESSAGRYGGSTSISLGGHSYLTCGSYYKKALSVVKPHENLEPLPPHHLCRRLLENPNPVDTSFELLYELDLFLELCGVAYLWAVPNSFGKPCELWVIPSHWVWPRTGGSKYVPPDNPWADHLIQYYEIRPWGGTNASGALKFPPNEVIMFKWPSPISKIDGYSKLDMAAQWIDTEESISRSRWTQMENTARPEVWVELGEGYTDPNDDVIARAEEKFMAKYQNSLNYGKPLITPPGAKINVLSFNPTEMAYFQSEEQIRDMILSVFRVPKAVVGIQNDMTYGSILAALAAFCSFAINPRLAMVGQRLTKSLASRFGDDDAPVRIWWDDCAPADPAQVNADIQADQSAVAIAPNEVRAIRGRKPWKNGGDDPMVSGPGGMMPLPLETGDDLSDLGALVGSFVEASQPQPPEQPGMPGMEGAPGMGEEGAAEGIPDQEGGSGTGGEPTLEELAGDMDPGIEEPNQNPQKGVADWDNWFELVGMKENWQHVKSLITDPALRVKMAERMELNRLDDMIRAKAVDKGEVERRLAAAGEELANHTNPAPMPGYGQIFLRDYDADGSGAQVWYVGGDGDEDGWTEVVEEKIREAFPGVTKITMEAEAFPPRKDTTWRQVYPKKGTKAVAKKAAPSTNKPPANSNTNKPAAGNKPAGGKPSSKLPAANKPKPVSQWRGKPCKPGVSAARTGCIPKKPGAGGDGEKKPRATAAELSEQRKPIVDSLKKRVTELLGGKQTITAENIQEVKDTLMKLTVSEIKALKADLQVKAGMDVKERLAQKIAERALVKKPEDVPEAKKPSPFGGKIGKKPKKEDSDGPGGQDGSQSDEAGGDVAEEAEGPVDEEDGGAGDGDDQSAGDEPAKDTATKKVVERLGKYEKLFRKKGSGALADWMAQLRDHISELGAEAALAALGEEAEGRDASDPIQYQGAYDDIVEAADKDSKFIKDYLAHAGIVLTGSVMGSDLATISSSSRAQLQQQGREVPTGEGSYVPTDQTFANKLEESKHLPGLESSEDIHKVVGSEVTQFTPEVIAKLDEKYGKGKWIVKSYGDEAYAGFGVFFPQRVQQIQRDAKALLADARSQLKGKGYKIVKNKEGVVVGIHQNGENFLVGTEEFASLGKTIQKLTKQAAISSHAATGTRLPASPEDSLRNDYGIVFRRGADGKLVGITNYDGKDYNFDSPDFKKIEDLDGGAAGYAIHRAQEADEWRQQGYDTKPKFMVQPAFEAVGVSDYDRAMGNTWETANEGRVHVTTQGGKAKAIPYATLVGRGDDLPAVFASEDSKAMEKAVEDAINQLPESERTGQVYAPDVVKTKDGWKVLELNPSAAGGGSDWLGRNPFVIDSMVSQLTGREPQHVRFIRDLLQGKGVKLPFLPEVGGKGTVDKPVNKPVDKLPKTDQEPTPVKPVEPTEVAPAKDVEQQEKSGDGGGKVQKTWYNER